MNKTKKIGQISILTILSMAGGLAIAVSTGVYTSMSYVNSSVKAATAPIAAQSQADHDALLKQTALMVVIAQKVGVPQGEVNQLLNK